MSSQNNSVSTDLEQKLQEITTEVLSTAQTNQQDLLFLLSLLRNLELIHRQIRTELFEPALPNSRNQLYQLVKDIEEQGGWPYIERMKLKELLFNLESNSSKAIESSQNNQPIQ